jgi:hypothetical protein
MKADSTRTTTTWGAPQDDWERLVKALSLIRGDHGMSGLDLVSNSSAAC